MSEDLSPTPFPRADLADWRDLLRSAGVHLDQLSRPDTEALVVEPLYVAPAAEAALPVVAGTPGWSLIETIRCPAADVPRRLGEAFEGGTDIGWWIERGGSVAGDVAKMLSDGLARVPDGRTWIVELAVAPAPGDPLVEAGRKAAASGRLHVVTDPLGAWANGSAPGVPYDTALARSMALAKAVTPARSLLCDGLVHHQAGATAVDELAAIVSTAIAYLEHADSPGFSGMVVRIGLGGEPLLDGAKLRAARLLLAAVGARCGWEQQARQVPLYGITGTRTRSRADVDTNLIRTSLAAFGGVLGGADGISVLPHDPREGVDARRWARNITHLLRHETHLGRVGDPCRGAYAMEQLTATVAAQAWTQVREILGQGGLAAMLRTGAWQGRLAATAAARREAITQGERPLVGVSKFKMAGVAGTVAMTRATSPALPNTAHDIEPLAELELCAPYEQEADR